MEIIPLVCVSIILVIGIIALAVGIAKKKKQPTSDDKWYISLGVMAIFISIVLAAIKSF